MADKDYSTAWNEALDGGLAGQAAPQPRVQPVPATDYADAWNDDTAGPLEKAARAAGVAPTNKPVVLTGNQPDEARKAP